MKSHIQNAQSSAAIDSLAELDALSAMLGSHIAALKAVAGAMTEIGRAASGIADTFLKGGTVYYAAAGSSGLMALSDASELSGTFQIPKAQIRVCMAGGVPVDGYMPGDTEDRTPDAVSAAREIRQGDVALVLSASGTTPYALAFAREAVARGALLVGIANTPGTALLEMADVAISLNTASEVVEGSTRLGAGTAQKAALNMISTQAGILMGHVHQGLMVNLKADNAKLRQRSAEIVSRVAGVPLGVAQDAVLTTGYHTKQAVLVAFDVSRPVAHKLLIRHRGHLAACLQDEEIKTKIDT